MVAGQKNRYLFVGLGNPGSKYEWTRHNLGFLVLKAFAMQHHLKFKQESRYQAELARGMIGEKEVHLLLPLTYMNESGRAIKQYMHEKQISLDELTVVVDDVDIFFKELRMRPSGSSGGHNGLKSIELHLQSRNYQRLRMGIGCESLSIPLENYVLQHFSDEEMSSLGNVVQQATHVLDRLLHVEFAQVMNEVNTKKSDLVKRLGEKNDSYPEKSL